MVKVVYLLVLSHLVDHIYLVFAQMLFPLFFDQNFYPMVETLTIEELPNRPSFNLNQFESI